MSAETFFLIVIVLLIGVLGQLFQAVRYLGLIVDDLRVMRKRLIPDDDDLDVNDVEVEPEDYAR